MAHEIRLDLVLTGFTCEPDEISSILNLQPTKTWRLGAQIPRTTITMKNNGWLLSSGLGRDKSFDEHLSSLEAVLRPHLGNFRRLPPGTEAELSCALYIQEDQASGPAVHLDSDSIKLLADLHAEIDFDIYNVVPGDAA